MHRASLALGKPNLAVGAETTEEPPNFPHPRPRVDEISPWLSPLRTLPSVARGLALGLFNPPKNAVKTRFLFLAAASLISRSLGNRVLVSPSQKMSATRNASTPLATGSYLNKAILGGDGGDYA